MNSEPEPQAARQADLVADTSGALDRAVQQDLQRIRAESLLARNDSAQELTRALDAALAEPLALSEITAGIDRLEGRVLPSFSELESLLASPETTGLTMERNLLAELIQDGGEAQSILKKGLVFLKHGRYPEALEWWALHRQGLDTATSRLSLLMLVMETLTHLWSGHPERAAATRNQVTAHRLFRQIRSGSAPH
jgi:hypothetical protein